MIPKFFSNIIFKRIGHKTIRYIKPIKYSDSKGDTRNIYDEIVHDYVLGAPFTLHACMTEIMAGVWSLVRESLIVNGKVHRITKEAIAGGVSISNQCPYCEAAHIKMSGGRIDEENIDLFNWSKNHYISQSKLVQNPPFTITEAPEIIGTALTFHYINRMVSVFVTNYPLPLPRFLFWLKPFISSFFKNTAAKAITQVNLIPGKSLERVPNIPVSSDFSWAESNSYIQKSFSGFDSLINNIGEKSIALEVRRAVLSYLIQWNGSIPDFGNKWLEDITKNLILSDRKKAKFILLVAIQPYRITERHINELRKDGVMDEELMTIAAWGGWQATKKIGSWLGTSFSNRLQT